MDRREDEEDGSTVIHEKERFSQRLTLLYADGRIALLSEKGVRCDLPERRMAMQNAHLRMGKLTFVRQTRDTITNITVGLNCLVAEPPDSQTATTLHLVSVFGGDQDIGAVLAAAHEALRFRVTTDTHEFLGTLGEKPVIYRTSRADSGAQTPRAPRRASFEGVL